MHLRGGETQISEPATEATLDNLLGKYCEETKETESVPEKEE